MKLLKYSAILTVCLALSASMAVAQGARSQIESNLKAFGEMLQKHELDKIRQAIPLGFRWEGTDGAVMNRQQFLQAIHDRYDFARDIKVRFDLVDSRRDGDGYAANVEVQTVAKTTDHNGRERLVVVREKLRTKWISTGGQWKIANVWVDELVQKVDGTVVAKHVRHD